MYRATHLLAIQSRNILHYRPPIEIQTKKISKSLPSQKYADPTERDTCPPPPPLLPPPPKDDRLLWGALSVLVMAGGFAFYAQQNPDVRDWLSLHAPWFDDLIAIVYQENMTYAEFAEECVDNMKKCLNKIKGNPKPKLCVDGKLKDAVEEPGAKISKCDENVVKPKCVVHPPPLLSKDICEFEACYRDLANDILNNYYTAKEACAYYNKLVEGSMINFELAGFKELHKAMPERIELVKTSLCNIAEASKQIDDLARYLECGVQAPKDAILETKGMISDFQEKITAARMMFQWENDKSIELDREFAIIEDLMVRYTQENQTLFSDLDYDNEAPVLKGDPDMLLYHSMRYAATLQEELSEASANMTERINRALETLPQGEKELKARNAQIDTESKRRIGDLYKEYYRRYELQRENNVKKSNNAMKKQLEQLEEILRIRLEQKEKEVRAKLDQMVAEKVAEEKKAMAILKGDMAAKLKKVEEALAASLKAERDTQRSQQLWVAGASLLAATKKGDPIVRVDKEIKAIENASVEDDKLVITVLKSIPDSVRRKGVVPESVLRERYHRMEKAALAVALVESDGAPLPIFALSWFQSLMLFPKLPCIPQHEIDKPPQEPFQGLDTFDLLRRARYYIERGNIATAMRYVSSLQGASRAAASTWHDDARAHLEAKQAAEAVIAHAAAMGLQYV